MGEVTAPEVTRHLSNCAHCQSRIALWNREIRLVRELMEKLSPVNPALSPEPGPSLSTIRKLMQKLSENDPDPSAFINSEEPTEPLPGQIGRYPILSVLDKGGQGSLYRAWHPTLKIDVVIKCSRWTLSESAVRGRRLMSEGGVLATLHHPRIVAVYDLGEHENRPFWVLEFIRGWNLKRHLELRQIDEQAILELMARITETIVYAHRQGVLHLDLKPENVLIDEQGNPKIIDFGLARCGLTGPGGGRWRMGTPDYMAPEQVAGRVSDWDQRTDIHGLGAILHFLMFQRPPDPPEPMSGSKPHFKLPRSRNSRLARELWRITQKSLKTNPAERYSSVEELSADIQRLLHWPARRKFWLLMLCSLACGVLLWTFFNHWQE